MSGLSCRMVHRRFPWAIQGERPITGGQGKVKGRPDEGPIPQLTHQRRLGHTVAVVESAYGGLTSERQAPLNERLYALAIRPDGGNEPNAQ